MRMRLTLPYAFEVKGSRQIGDQTSDFITALCQLKDATFYFDDMTLNAHCKRCSSRPQCAHRLYEQERLNHTHITESTRFWKNLNFPARASENDRKVFTCRILPALQEFTVKIDCLKSKLKNHGNVKKWQTPLAIFDDVKRFCKEISELLNEYKLPLKCKAEMGRLHRCRSRCWCQQQ